MWVAAFIERLSATGHRVLSQGDLSSVPPDVIVLAGLDADQLGVSAIDAIGIRTWWRGRHDVKIVCRLNECDARKGTAHVDNMFRRMAPQFDGTVFVSSWLRDYFGDWPGKSCVIHNGVDRKLFRPRPNIRLYDRARTRIVAHHWSNNPLKGFDFYEKLDRFAHEHDEYVFHYIGRDRGTFKGKNTIVTPACHGEALASALAEPRTSSEVYVTASRFDPGPNHVLEALSCGLRVLSHADGGGAVEFAGAEHTYSSFEQLQSMLANQYAIEKNAYVPLEWDACIDAYTKFMEDLCRNR